MAPDKELIGASDVRFLPIFSAFAAKLGIVEEVDKRIKTRGHVSCGRIVLALILDALSGRSPLFRLQQFLADKDMKLLLGEDIPVSKFNDDAIGRTLDRLFDYGTNKILTAIALNAVGLFDLNTTHVRHDTTSHSVYGNTICIATPTTATDSSSLKDIAGPIDRISNSSFKACYV